jgi:methyltransferase-like protein
MSIDKIGLTVKSHEFVRRGLVKSFKGLRESTFTEMVEKVFNENNATYASKIEDFKSLQARVAQNQVEENKLKDFLTKNVISVLNPTYLKNSALNLNETEFEVAVPLPRTGWSNSEIDILNIRKKTDDLENMTIRLTFFGAKTKEATTAAEAISFITAVFQNDLAKTVDIISRANIV